MLLTLAIISFIQSANVIAANVNASDGISYDDLIQLNISCYPYDACSLDFDERRHSSRVENSPFQRHEKTCDCNEECSYFDTCCIDSLYRGKSSIKYKCTPASYPVKMLLPAYYMVNICPENSVWKHLCEAALDRDGDFLRIAPVSSLDTNTTYKNYYCFRCYEQTDKFLFWDLEFLVEHKAIWPGDYNVPDFEETWSETFVNKILEEFFLRTIPVTFEFHPPEQIGFAVRGCNVRMVTDCPESWKDDTVKYKCNSYMAVLYILYNDIPYKNIHCALCNSVRLDKFSCKRIEISNILPYTLGHFIYLNWNEGNKKPKCAKSETWDPYRKKCIKLSCLSPGYVIKDDKCVPP